jgi:hypothetical protein
MIDPELVAKIRLLFFAEHWKIGTIASQLNLHRDTVRAALETDRFNRPKQDRAARKTDPYVDFIRQTLTQYPRLRSTRIFQMIRARGYAGGSSQLPEEVTIAATCSVRSRMSPWPFVLITICC